MLLEAAYRSGNKAVADKISQAVKKDMNEQMAYYNAIGSRAEGMSYEVQRNQLLLQLLGQLEASLTQELNAELPAELNTADSPQVTDTPR